MDADNTSLKPEYREFVPGESGPGVAEQVNDLLAAVDVADGVPAYSEAFLRSLDGAEGSVGYRHLTASVDGRVVGVVSVNSTYTAEMAVHPDMRRRGIAGEMLREVGRHLDGEKQLSVWAHGDLAEAQNFAGDRQARMVRELLKMSVDCSEDGPDSHRADLLARRDEAVAAIDREGLTVLDYTASCGSFGAERVDAEWLRVNNQAFAWHPEQGGWAPADLDAARDTDWFDPAGVLLLWDGEECLGFHWTKRPAGDPHGEVYVVCLADGARGRGLGGPVTLVGVGHLIDGGAEAVDLYVEGDNAPAVATYRRLGFEVVHRDVVYRGIL